MRDLPTIFTLYRERRSDHAPAEQAWKELARVYDGELVNRIAETDETVESSVPNIISQGINGYARRAASVTPDVDSPALRPNIASSRTRASDRATVIKGWYQASNLALGDYQRFRHFFGYGSAPVIIRSHPKMVGVPRWEVRSPTGVLPGPRDLRYTPEVPDCFVATTQSARWLRDNYGVTFTPRRGERVRDDALLEVVEYTDAEQITLFVVGPAACDAATSDWTLGSTYDSWGARPYGQELRDRHITPISGPDGSNGTLVLLSSVPNLAGMCTVSCPGVISLSKVAGFVNGILARHKLHSRMLVLTTKGIAKGIFPNEWFIADPNVPDAGIEVQADPLRGVTGIVKGGTLALNQITPGYQTMPFLDRLESYSREEAGIPSEWGGSSGTNIRTRARGESVLGATIDPPLAEAHEIMQAAREHENRIAVAVAKAYGGSRPRSFYVYAGRKKVGVTYVATDLFETDETTVRYPVAGTDAQGLIIMASQSASVGALSKHDMRVMSPLVEDVGETEKQIRVEALEDVALNLLASQVATLSPDDLAEALRMARRGEMTEDIIAAIQRRAQERQATAGAPGEPTGPALPGSPEAQPGLGAPGAAAVPPTIAQPPPSISNLASLMVQLRQPGRTSPAERVGAA